MTNVTHKFLSLYLFLFIILYMFRAHRAHHQERQIVSIQPLVTVTLCWWPCRVKVAQDTAINTGNQQTNPTKPVYSQPAHDTATNTE